MTKILTSILISALLLVSSVSAGFSFQIITWECVFCHAKWVGKNPNREIKCSKLRNDTHAWIIKEVLNMEFPDKITKNTELVCCHHDYHTTVHGSVK